MQNIEETKEQIETIKETAVALNKVTEALIPFDQAELLPDEKNFIITNNLILRASRATDLYTMALILRDSKAMKYYGNGKVRTQKEVEEFANYRADANNNPAKGVFTWVVFAKEGPIGYQAVRFPKDPNAPKELIVATIPEYQGKGYTKEAANALMSFVGGLFFTTVHPDYKIGIKFLESLCFIKDLTKQNVEKHESIRDYYVCHKYENHESQLVR